MSHGTHIMNESWHTHHECHSRSKRWFQWTWCVCRDSLMMCVPWLAHNVCAMTHAKDDHSSHDLYAMSHSYVWRDAVTCMTWLGHVCDMPLSHVWHDSMILVHPICVLCLIHMCDVTQSHVWHVSVTCVTWLICICDMPQAHVWHVSVTSVPCRTHMCDVSHSHVWHVSVTCAVCLSHTCDMPQSHVWHASFLCVTCLSHKRDTTRWFQCTQCACHDSFICVTWIIHMCDVTYSYVWHDSFKWVRDTFMCDVTHSYVWRASWIRDSFIWVRDAFKCVTWLIHIYDVPHKYVRRDSQHVYWALHFRKTSLYSHKRALYLRKLTGNSTQLNVTSPNRKRALYSRQKDLCSHKRALYFYKTYR